MARASSKQEARLKAAELFKQYYKVPVEVERIARDSGVSVIYHALPSDVSGFLIVKHRKPVAVVNSNHSESRQRFTLAHELGHYKLHYDASEELFHRDERSSRGTSRIEVQANAFAAELLMPREIIEKELGGESLDMFDSDVDSRLNKLVKMLGVSQQALDVRLQQLGYLI